MLTTVNWAVFPGGVNKPELERLEVNILFQEPENLLKKIHSIRKESLYLKCYSLIDSLKNTYVIKSPLDLRIKCDRSNKWLYVDGIDQNIYNLFVRNRFGQFSDTDPVFISCLPSYVFYSDSPVKMTIWPTPFLGEVENARVVVGGFDISKWVRPIDWTFEVVDDTKEVVVKRGDPLFAVNFSTPDDSVVELNRVPFDKDLHDVEKSCVTLKRAIKQVPLKKCYEMADSFISMWRKYRSK